MSARRTAFAWLAPLALAAALAAVWLWRSPQINASLYDLIGDAAGKIPQFLRDASASEIAVVVSAPDRETALEAAREFGGTAAGDRDLPSGALEFIRAHRGGLATRETAKLLETEEGRRRIAKRAARRIFMSPVPPMLGYADDPFGVTDEFLLSLGGIRGSSSPEGYPLLETNGTVRALVRMQLSPEQSASIDKTIAFCGELEKKAQRISGRGVSVHLAGTPVHAAKSAARSKTEFAALSAFSLTFIVVLSWWALRSWRRMAMVAATLTVAALAGSIALALLFREVHAITLVMGTTVLGLAVDYAFHRLMSSPDDCDEVRRNLRLSLLTTEISLLPLIVSGIPVLRQSSVFLSVALAAALGYVLAGATSGTGTESVPIPDSRRRACRWLVAVSLAVLAAGLPRTNVGTGLAALYRPPPELAEGERLRAQFGAFSPDSLPTLAERRKIAADVERLYAEHGGTLAATLQISGLVPPGTPVDVCLRPQEMMAEMFGEWTRDATLRLAVAGAAMLAVLWWRRRRRAWRLMAPPLAAVAAVAGLLGLLGEPVNVFHLLAAFLLLGMSVDYALFLQAERPAWRPAACSLLTSMAGFGALAFVSFPVVSAFGTVLGAGLPVAFAAAVACGVRKRDDGGHEHGASTIGLEILWLIYRVGGLRTLHFTAAAVGAAVWLCSPAVRRASPSFRKMLFFTRSLADKMAVMAQGGDLPRTEPDESADVGEFIKSVLTGRGVFVLSSHCGTVEMLVAMGRCGTIFHAWTDVARTSVFNRFYLRHARQPRVRVHPVETIGLETSFWAGEAIEGGECLVMAGDRGRGAFRFARAMGHPVYFAACVWTGRAYRAIVRRLPDTLPEMERAYGEALAAVKAEHPEQDFTWRN